MCPRLLSLIGCNSATSLPISSKFWAHGVHAASFIETRQGLVFVFWLHAWCVYSAPYSIDYFCMGDNARNSHFQRKCEHSMWNQSSFLVSLQLDSHSQHLQQYVFHFWHLIAKKWQEIAFFIIRHMLNCAQLPKIVPSCQAQVRYSGISGTDLSQEICVTSVDIPACSKRAYWSSSTWNHSLPESRVASGGNCE